MTDLEKQFDLLAHVPAERYKKTIEEVILVNWMPYLDSELQKT